MLLLSAGLMIFIPLLLTYPWVFLTGAKGELLGMTPAKADLPLAIHFIHSVQKTPVEEDLAVNTQQNGFILHRTKYQSFGVGLPFLATDGKFHHEDDYFVMDQMERPFPTIPLRTGKGTKLQVRVGNTMYPLYQQVPEGAQVNVCIGSFGQWLWYRIFR